MKEDWKELCEKPLYDLINRFKQNLTTERMASPHTVSSYISDIKKLILFLKKKSVGKVKIDSVEKLDITTLREWLYDRIEKEISNRSNTRAISAIKTFFCYLADNDTPINKSIFDITKPKLPKLLPKAIEEEDFRIFFRTIDNHKKEKWKVARDKSIVLLMFTSGTRISETLNITKSDIISEKGHITVIGKGTKHRSIPITDSVKQQLKEYLESCPYKIDQNATLFRSDTGKKYTSRMAQLMFQDVRRRSGLPENITPHSMRHSCATILLSNSSNSKCLKNIQSLLGHSKLTTTQIYTKVSKQKLIDSLESANYWNNKHAKQ